MQAGRVPKTCWGRVPFWNQLNFARNPANHLKVRRGVQGNQQLQKHFPGIGRDGHSRFFRIIGPILLKGDIRTKAFNSLTINFTTVALVHSQPSDEKASAWTVRKFCSHQSYWILWHLPENLRKMQKGNSWTEAKEKTTLAQLSQASHESTKVKPLQHKLVR